MGLFRRREPEMQMPDQSNFNVNLPESGVELQKALIHPEAQWNDMLMDVVVSNLGERELYIVREYLDMAGNSELLELPELADFCRRQAMIILNTARSRGGFERRMLATSIIQQAREKREGGKK